MPKRFTFKKISDGEPAKCYYCTSKTNFALYDLKDESEVWACQNCALKYGKIKRLKNLLKNYSTSPKKAILKQNSLYKNSEKLREQAVKSTDINNTNSFPTLERYFAGSPEVQTQLTLKEVRE